MSLPIDNEGPLERSLEELIGPSKSAMVYGFYHCGYNSIHYKLKEMNFKVYSFGLSDSKRVPKELSFLIYDENKLCETSLTNIVVENYKRTLQENQNLITILFCINTNNNPYSAIDLSDAKQYKDLKKQELITIDELTRAYKICYDPNVDPRIRNVALKTFKFIKVINDSDGKVVAVEKSPPSWSKGYVATSNKAKKGADPLNWRYQVNAIVKLCNMKSNLLLWI